MFPLMLERDEKEGKGMGGTRLALVLIQIQGAAETYKWAQELALSTGTAFVPGRAVES